MKCMHCLFVWSLDYRLVKKMADWLLGMIWSSKLIHGPGLKEVTVFSRLIFILKDMVRNGLLISIG